MKIKNKTIYIVTFISWINFENPTYTNTYLLTNFVEKGFFFSILLLCCERSERELEERERALEAVSGPTRDFLNLSNKLADNLTKVSDDLDDVAVSKADVENKLKAQTGIAQNLDNQRPLFSEVMAVGDNLMDILTDPASKSEIKSKRYMITKKMRRK